MARNRAATIPAEFADLPFGEKLLLWAIRLWATEAREKTNDQDVLRQGFKVAGVPDGHLALDEFLGFISASSLVLIDVRCSNCSEISEDEHMLLGVIAAWQQGHGKDHGTAILSLWLPQTALRCIQTSASKLAHILKQRGLFIRPRCWRQSESNTVAPLSSMPHGSRTIH